MQLFPFGQQHKGWFFIAFVSLILAGILGITMRLAFVIELPLWINYKNILHTHSHLAMMGWIFCGLYIFITYYFRLTRKIYRSIFWLIQISIAGMLVSFPIQGYGLVSISFTTLHLFLSYIFVFNIFKDLRDEPGNYLHNCSNLFLKTAGLFLIVSTIGTWGLGIIMNTSFKGSALYYASIQFFLHFQFNGWFIFGIIAIFLKLCGNYIKIGEVKEILYAYWYLLASCILTYALSVTWSTPENFIFWVNSIGVILQAIALYYIIKATKRLWGKVVSHLKKWVIILFKMAFFGLIAKILIQTFVAIPYLATVSYTIKNFVIGFIHLLMLGSLTSFLIGNYEQFSTENKYNLGLWLFLAGFLLSETILFIQGLMLWVGAGFMPNYYTWILTVSILMPLGFIIYLLKKIKEQRIGHH